MNYSYLLHSIAWGAHAARRIFSPRQSAAAVFAVVLALGATLMAAGIPAQAQEKMTTTVETVNINAADADALAAGLKGVGPTRAQEIVRYRESYGPFASVEELAEVQGISKATLDKNRAAITLD